MKRYLILLILLSGCAERHGIKVSGTSVHCIMINNKGSYDLPEYPMSSVLLTTDGDITIKCAKNIVAGHAVPSSVILSSY